MRAIRVNKPGDASELVIGTAPNPSAAAGEIVVQVEAAGVNFLDVYQRTGLYKVPMPFTPGSEAAGTVVAVGSAVQDFAIGDRVAYAGVLGAYAELAKVPAERAVRVPDGVTTRQAAAAMLQGMTAHYLACSTFVLQAGHVCLIHAAAGGVGLLLCQIAKLRGATIIATTSTAEKAELARSMGADHVVVYAQGFVQEVKRLTAGRGVDVIYDGVGKTTFDQDLDCLAPRGMLVLFGQSSGPVPPIDPQILQFKGSLFLTRPILAHYVATRSELVARAGAILGWIRDGKVVLRMEHEFLLSRAADAHRALESRQTTGKILLVP